MAETKTTKLTRAEADALRIKAADLRRSIVEAALSDSEFANIAAVQQFRASHTEQRRETDTGRQRAEQLGKARTELEPLESDRKQKQQALSKTQASLREFHRSLGQAAFQGRLEGNVTDQPVFAERLAVHERIEELRKEYDSLAPASNAGTVTKAKAKAQQLAVAGRIKLEETKIGKLDSQIGQRLIEESQEGSVRCEQTKQVLSQVAERQGEIAQLAEQESLSREALATKVGQLMQALNLPKIESSLALDDELKRCNAAVAQAEKTLRELGDELPAKLLADASIPADSKMGGRLAELRQIEEQVQHAPKSPVGLVVDWFTELNTTSKALVAGGAATVCLFLLGSIVVQADRQAYEEANALWSAGEKSKAVEKYRPLVNATHFTRDQQAKILSRVIDFDLEQGNDSMGKELIEEALDRGLSVLPIDNPKADRLVAQVKVEREQREVERRAREREERKRREAVELAEREAEAAEKAREEEEQKRREAAELEVVKQKMQRLEAERQRQIAQARSQGGGSDLQRSLQACVYPRHVAAVLGQPDEKKEMGGKIGWIYRRNPKIVCLFAPEVGPGGTGDLSLAMFSLGDKEFMPFHVYNRGSRR